MIIASILITLLITFSSALSAITGFGTSTISVPILLHFFSLPQTLLFVGIIHWTGTIVKMLLYKDGFSRKLLINFGLPSLLASFLGAQLTFAITQQKASLLLGIFLITYVIFIFLNPRYKLKSSNQVAFTGGSISGFFAGLFGLGGALRAVFLGTFNLPKTMYLFTTNCIAFFTDVTRLSTYVGGGMRLTPLLWWSLIFSLPLSFLGAYFAKQYVDIIPQKQFRKIVAFFLGLIGLKLIFFS